MGLLGKICDAVEAYNRDVERQMRDARHDAKAGKKLLARWRRARDAAGVVTTPTGLELPGLALPDLDEPGAIARHLAEQGLPGEFPFVTAAYRQMYLLRDDEKHRQSEEPTRLFAGFGLAEDTNARFHYLRGQQRSARLSTAFDGPTLYGLDSDADGAAGKIGEGGVAVDTADDMARLYDGFDLADGNCSVSMTINGPAPTILAMYVAAAVRRFGPRVLPNLRGTIQADILKEVQAQNECLFPVDASLRFLTDMVEWVTDKMPRFYPISVSGYHIAEAGSTPVQQAAFTLSNGFTYVELFGARGLSLKKFGPRLSFFLDCGLDIEYLALARVCRKVWAIGMRDCVGAPPAAQILKLHTQTSGRSLVAAEFQNNLTRTAVELMLAYMNATNSCHSNSADEPFTTPSQQYVRLAAHAQAILLEESGLFRHTMLAMSGSPGMIAVARAVEAAILAEFRELDHLGGVLPAMEQRYQRAQIQAAAHVYEKQINEGVRPIIGVNRYAAGSTVPQVAMVRTALAKRKKQLARLTAFKKKNAKAAPKALARLQKVVESNGNVFAELIKTVEVCSLGQITESLHEVVGHFRPTV